MRIFAFLCIPFFLFACASSKTTGSLPRTDSGGSQSVPPGSPADASAQTGQGISISVDNPTVYNVFFEGEQRVGRKSKGGVSLLIEDATLTGGFDILYEILLSDTTPLYCKGDHRTIREVQKNITIKEPNLIENYGVFIKLVNKADNAISFYSGSTVNPAWEQRGSPAKGNFLARTDKREFSPHETAVFNISHDSALENYAIRDSRKTIPLALPRKEERNYVYTFEYSAKGLELTDARPLHRAGETGWTKTVSEAASPLVLAAGDGGVNLFAQTGNGVMRHAFDSAGNAASPVRSGDRFELTAAIPAADGFFVAGYEEPKKGSLRPVALLIGADGATRRILEPSNRRECQQAYFLAAAHTNSEWLVAGAAGENALSRLAYTRLVRDNGGAFVVVWEKTGLDFEGKIPPSGARCGEITSAAYDSAHSRWLVTGKNIEFDSMHRPITGSFVAMINSNGNIQKTDTSFKGMSFNKILPGADGVCYLAGEEQRGNETYAMLLAYNADSGQTQILSDQNAAHSFYQDALVDGENSRIILGGVMRAKTESGQGGIPFVEAVDMAKGVRLWLEELSGPAFASAALVTAIVPAPDYGFALSLCGVADNYFAQPFVIARVNSQGKYIK